MMKREIPKQYQPEHVEPKWAAYWEEHGYFHSEPDEREAYAVVIPPPNVTGVLHMGHMLNNTIQDVLVRRARMLGLNACWVPGTDHASIATEAKVVQRLRKQGLSKRDLSRDEFLEHAWAWTEEHGGIILDQLKKLGASCDWKRTRFTLEEGLYEAVIDAFVELYDRGLIYRGRRMVNWDPAAQTALSDEEVIYREVQSKLYVVRYPVVDEAAVDGAAMDGAAMDGASAFLTIATTRPETILADTAICVHPDDPRYQSWIGRKVRVPLTDRVVPVIADEYVEMEFGTGCLKITPAHDENDYMIGERHSLDVIDMLNADGTVAEVPGMSEVAEGYVGEDRFVVRKRIVKDLEEAGFLVRVEDLTNKVGYSERTDAVIEPRLSLQWFCDMEELSRPALEHVMNDDIRFFPEKFKNSYRNWMENIRDWCISRQLWWGHRIPAWYFGEGEEEYVIARSAEEALAKAREKSGNGSMVEGDLWQDEDVLDTWFSSWLWPISVFDPEFIRTGEPNRDLEYYYPTQDLVTAPEIMFFWVARMVMAGYAFAGEKPFSNVYYHGIVRDEKRRKMSKSLGNSPDPLDLIATYGADGTRVGMLFSSPAGNDLLFDEKLCEQGRNFSNKIWNAFRFLTMNLERDDVGVDPALEALWREEAGTSGVEENVSEATLGGGTTFNLADRWLIGRIVETLEGMEHDFEQFRLNEALKKIYSLIWDDFCDWYIEVSKSDEPGANMPQENLTRAFGLFEVLMKMLHPFMPFLTEEIWQQIRQRTPEDALTISKWPSISWTEASTGADADLVLFARLQSLVRAVRNIQAEMNLAPRQELSLVVKPASLEECQLLEEEAWVLKRLLPIASLVFDVNAEKPKASAATLIDGIEVFVPLEGLIDFDKERARLQKEIDRLQGFMSGIEKKLSNEKFVANAPAEVVEKERKKLADAKRDVSFLADQMQEFM